MLFLQIALAAVVGIFALIPLRAAAEYRFRNKTGLLVEGLAFLFCAVYGFFTGSWILLAIGAAAGVGIRQIKGNNQRYIE